MVDATRSPIDFKALDAEHVALCATKGLCGVCGARIRRGPIAFIGPDDGRACFADPWMHPECADVALEQCPFLARRRDWREGGDEELLAPYSDGMALRGRAVSRIVSKRRRLTQAQARMELYATARQVDSAAAQVLMLSEDDCVDDAEHDELEALGRALRRVGEDLFARAGHA